MNFAPLLSLDDYEQLDRALASMLQMGDLETWKTYVRGQAEVDFYAFGRYVSGAGKVPAPEGSGVELAIKHPYIYKGYRMVQDRPWNVFDNWPRGHWKSKTKTECLVLWEFIRYDGNLCQCIVSILRGLAKKHLSELMTEMESNPLYYLLWPDFFFEKPASQARPWSLDDGMNQRQGMLNPRMENQFEARGLETSPTGAHFDRRIDDDLSDETTVGNPELVAQARQNWNLWEGLANESAPGGFKFTCHGTYYEEGDLNCQIVAEELVGLYRHRDCVVPSDDPDTVDIGGDGAYLSNKRLREKLTLLKENYPPQMRGDPSKGRRRKLDRDLVQTFRKENSRQIAAVSYLYVLVDPNGWSDNDENDLCAIGVVALHPDRNYYLLDLWYGRPNPGERCEKILQTHIDWKNPGEVWIEEVAQQADSHWLTEVMERRNHRFTVRPIQVPRTVTTETGRSIGLKKKERIYRAIHPLLESRRLYVPKEIWGQLGGRDVNFAELFREEMDRFPIGRGCNGLAMLALLFCQGDHVKAAPALAWPSYGDVGINRHYSRYGNLIRPHAFGNRPRDWRAA